jgi:hypothetical protein
MEEEEMMNHENKDWRDKLEDEVCRFARMIRELAYSAAYVGAIVLCGYTGTQIFEEHKALMRTVHCHFETYSSRQKHGYFINTAKSKSKRKSPPTSPLEPVLIPMGPPPSP